MILITAGMQKSGTGWYFRLATALLSPHGGVPVEAVRARSSRAAAILRTHNGELGRPTLRRLVPVIAAVSSSEKLAVKTHARPPATLRILLRTGRLRATYLCRDPRDVALSAFDAARRPGGGAGPQMRRITTIADAIHFTAALVPTWRAWMSISDVLALRYEDLWADPRREVDRLCEHLRLDVSTDHRDALVRQYPRGEPPHDDATATHFNRGIIGRYREVMSEQELELCGDVLGPALEEMGYST